MENVEEQKKPVEKRATESVENEKKAFESEHEHENDYTQGRRQEREIQHKESTSVDIEEVNNFLYNFFKIYRKREMKANKKRKKKGREFSPKSILKRNPLIMKKKRRNLMKDLKERSLITRQNMSLKMSLMMTTKSNMLDLLDPRQDLTSLELAILQSRNLKTWINH